MAKVKPVEFYGVEVYNEAIDGMFLFVYDEWGHGSLAAEKLSANGGDLSERGVSDFVCANLSEDWDMKNIMDNGVEGIGLYPDVDEEGYRYYNTGLCRERELKNRTVDDPVYIYVVNDEPISVSVEPDILYGMLR